MGNARVIAVAADDKHRFSKKKAEEIHVLAGLGVEGDAHLGKTVKHRSRVRFDPTQPNLRQVHLMQAELFDELVEKGFTVGPADLGENVTTRGVDLLSLPRGAVLKLGADVELEVTGLRNPCSQIDKFQPGLPQRRPRQKAGRRHHSQGGHHDDRPQRWDGNRRRRHHRIASTVASPPAGEGVAPSISKFPIHAGMRSGCELPQAPDGGRGFTLSAGLTRHRIFPLRSHERIELSARELPPGHSVWQLRGLPLSEDFANQRGRIASSLWLGRKLPTRRRVFVSVACRRETFGSSMRRHRERRKLGKKNNLLRYQEVIGWSEWSDSNTRPPRPERGALPDCATLRDQRRLYRPAILVAQASMSKNMSVFDGAVCVYERAAEGRSGLERAQAATPVANRAIYRK